MENEKEYKKSYWGIVLWIIGFCAAYFLCVFVPSDDTQIVIAIADNIMTIGCFVLSWIVYLTEKIYWYNGTDYEVAKKAGSERRKKLRLNI